MKSNEPLVYLQIFKVKLKFNFAQNFKFIKDEKKSTYFICVSNANSKCSNAHLQMGVQLELE